MTFGAQTMVKQFSGCLQPDTNNVAGMGAWWSPTEPPSGGQPNWLLTVIFRAGPPIDDNAQRCCRF
jgi:hypothetical protein